MSLCLGHLRDIEVVVFSLAQNVKLRYLSLYRGEVFSFRRKMALAQTVKFGA